MSRIAWIATTVLTSGLAAWAYSTDAAVDEPAEVTSGNPGPAELLAVMDSPSSDTTTADGIAGKTSRKTAKPTAPVDVRWLSTGEDGIVSLEIVSGVDQVGANVRLIAPGIGRPLVVQLPAAVAGEIQPAEWTVSRPLHGPLRAVVEIDTGDQTMARIAVAPGGDRKADRRPVTRVPSDAGVSGQKMTTDALVELPAEQTIRRKGN